jgi:NADH dehydrogenase
MFGNGQMRLQPFYVEDVGQAIAKMMQSGQTGPTMFECGGPRVHSYEELLKSRRECSPHQADLVSGPSLPGAH